jgi:hypothetical protein
MLFVLGAMIALLCTAGTAGAVVVDPAAAGQPSVTFPNDQSNYVGVALLPGTSSDLATAQIPTVVTGGTCSDPWLSSDLAMSSGGLCWHNGGNVVHANETFALTWDQYRSYWSMTRNYVEQFLRDVADGSGTLTSPFAETGQYRDANGRAANNSVYAGGCIDYGAVGGSACQLGNTSGSGAGHDYPASGCTATGSLNGVSNTVCLTDAQLGGEVATLVTQTGLLAKLKPGYQPVVDLLLPSGVEACVDGSGALCSVGSNAAAQLCSFHSHVNVGGTDVTYVVQPWTINSNCDEPGLPPLGSDPTALDISIDAGRRLVSPLSQGQMATLTDPDMNAWFAPDGSEVNDNGGCVPLPRQLDQVTVGSSLQNPYWLQREFNNASVIASDPFVMQCTPGVTLSPAFVVPSAINAGDQVQFDGSNTASTLIVPSASYLWDFGDGTTAVGPSVVHSFKQGGNYTVTLTVVDRGGNVRALSQAVSVLGSAGKTITAPSNGAQPLKARLQLLPQSFRAMLHNGVAIRVTSNQRADGFVSVSIGRSAARRAHLRIGRGASVVIGRGTVSGINKGTVVLHMRVTRATAAKLLKLGHLTLSIQLSLMAAGRNHLTIDAAGHY